MKAIRPATTSAQIRLRSNSAPALEQLALVALISTRYDEHLEQVTTVPGPTVQAASMVQYSMELSSRR